MAGDPHWRELALCAQTDPDAFFHEDGYLVSTAKRICAMCEVKAECLRNAIDDEEIWGVRGGLSERERKRMRNVKSKAA